MSNRDLGEQRRDYVAEPLQRSGASPNPFAQFSKWYGEAEKHCPGYPNPMILSTADSNGQPFSRVVLLKSFDDQGFVFYTNYESQKAQQIDENNLVSILFFWEALERQVIIRGTATKTSTEQASIYFASRPYDSQIAAWASEQSSVLENKEALKQRFSEIQNSFKDKPMECPPNWGGYSVFPDSIEFWQGQPSRMHDRLIYRRKESDSEQPEWSIQRLSP